MSQDDLHREALDEMDELAKTHPAFAKNAKRLIKQAYEKGELTEDYVETLRKARRMLEKQKGELGY